MRYGCHRPFHSLSLESPSRKHVVNLEKEGYEVPFGYEEAIGFMFGSEIRDKDGVAATVRRRAVHRRDAHG